MRKNKSVLLSVPYIIWMVVFTLIPLGVVGYYALQTRIPAHLPGATSVSWAPICRCSASPSGMRRSPLCFAWCWAIRWCITSHTEAP